MDIKAFLNTHPKIDYCVRFLRNRNDKVFVETVLAIKRDPNLLYFKSYGKENPDINFYDIFLDYPSKGFFALLIQTLDALRYADRFALTPVVTWSDSCLYKEKEKVNGTTNPFEYYYEATSAYTKEELEHSLSVLQYRDYQRYIDKNHPFGVVSKTIVENGYYDSYISQNAEIYRKYIKLKAPVLAWIQHSMEDIGFTDNTLGVHVRATDFKKGYIDHAKAVTCNEYIKAVQSALLKYNFNKVFLATDEIDVVEEFRKEFNDLIICCDDVYRSMDGSAIHFSNAERVEHKYKLGLEVIRDMYLLSMCRGLIGGYSNVLFLIMQ